MKTKFPPVTVRDREIRSLINVVECVIVDRSAVYVSTPITSGQRFARWSSNRNVTPDLSHPETYEDFKREVLDPNSEHARRVIESLRSGLSINLIDPTALNDIDGWVQDDYRAFWAEVIERFAQTVIFLDGWQYSNGCAYEFLVANRMTPRPSILDEKLQPLKLEQGIRMVESAIVELQELKLPIDFLEHVLSELAKLRASEHVLAEV